MDKVGVKDEIGMEIIEEQRKTFNREIVGLKENIKLAEDARENYTKQWDIDNELYGIILSGAKRLEPQFEYENEPRYWELRQKQGEFKYTQDKHLAESRIAGYQTQIDQIQEHINKVQKDLDKLDEDEKNE